MMHLSSVVLPMPLRPIRHMREPAGTVEIHIPQGVAAAVKLIEGLDRQHGSHSQIDFDHARIVLHFVHIALGDHAALRATP